MITNRSVAQRLNVSESMVSRLRSGQRRPGARLLIDLVLIYGLDTERALSAWKDPEALAGMINECVFGGRDE